METKQILERVEDIVAPVLENLGYELIERELLQESGRWVLRLYIDKTGGVTIDDCERASRGIEDVIEVSEAVPFGYNLEVSSPGINRPLRHRADFDRYKGRAIKLKTTTQIDGRANYKGILEGMEGDFILMVVDGIRYKVPYEALAKARLEVEETPKQKM